jgi:hypothetical protein
VITFLGMSPSFLVFCAIHVISKESRLLDIRRNSCLKRDFISTKYNLQSRRMR